MRTRYAKALLAVLCGWLFGVNSGQAQLTRDWSYDISTLGPYVSIDRPVIVDDSGNAFVLSYAGSALAGARVTKIKPDSTIAWQVSYPDSGLYLKYFGRSPAGDLYVFGYHEIYGGYDVSAVGIKINANGTLAWGRNLTAELAPYLSNLCGAVDIDGNLWIGFAETPTDSFCIDSLPDGSGEPGESGVMSDAVVYRIDSYSGTPTLVERVSGEDRQPVGVWSLSADSEGLVNVGIYVVDFCCNSLCQNCRDSCFENYMFHMPTGFRITYNLNRYTTGGGPSGSTLITASDNPIYSAYVFTGRSGELLIFKHEYRSPQPYWTHVDRFGHWATSFSGETQLSASYAPTTDYSGNVLLWHWIVSTIKEYDEDDDRETMVLDAATGSVKWTKPGIAGYMGADRDGNIYVNDFTAVHKFNQYGTEQWICTTGVNLGSILHADTSGWFYFQNYTTLARYNSTKRLTIRDVWGDSLANVAFELIKIADDAPMFTEDTLGFITTDNEGKIEMVFVTDSSFEVVHDNGSDTLIIGDAFMISKVLDDSMAVKHQASLGTMYSIHLDNMVIDSLSRVFYDTLTDESAQDIYLTHSEVRYNLLVSLDWDATSEYLESLQESFRRMANYLYDVTDGQTRLDTVMIYDDREHWDIADIRIHASNTVHPCADVKGIHDPANGKMIYLPRKWFGNETDCRNLSYDEHPLVLEADVVFRTTAHELGHYALGFYDEYLFVGGGVHCPIVDNFGFMEYQYSDGGIYSSEMSSSFKYTDVSCRNTEQYAYNNRSCWGQFEAWFERRYGADDILLPIIKPDDAERELITGDNCLNGPNFFYDDPAFLDYNAGARVVFPIPIAPPGVNVKTLNLQVLNSGTGIPEPDLDVVLRKGALGVTLRDIPQGATSDMGLIYVLGAEDGDQVMAAGTIDTLGTEKNGNANRIEKWVYGEATVGTSGLSRLNNLYDLSPQEDSVTITVRAVSGEYPMIFRPSIKNDSMAFFIDYLNRFSSAPEVEIRPDGGSASVYSLSEEMTTYTTNLADSLGLSGSLLVWGIDDSGFVFPATADYLTAVKSQHLIGPYGGAEVYPDTSATLLDRILMVSTPYPPVRTGLSDYAIQAGRIHMISYLPEGSSAEAALIIRYDDNDLKVTTQITGDESSLRIYKWTSNTWLEVGGRADIIQNTVYGTITGDGVHAAFTTQIITDVEDNEYGDVLPYRFELSQNYPNPFNPVTTIQYNLPERSHVTIEVYNVLGQKVRTLVDREESAGSYKITWDGTSSSGNAVSSGVYLYRFQADDYTETKKMVLLK
ncbi:MAG: FlgD immunoglobulin-like domain containing protein [Candidatus Zixiibacteriota bacterium]